MTEEAEKLIGTREEERDDGKEEVVEKVDGESEMKTDTYDLVILGASGFTGDHSKVLKNDLVYTSNYRSVCGPVRVQSCKRAPNNLGSSRY